jgi:hypothetical protein
VPPGATVVVASQGDEGLLQLHDRRAWHFPQDEAGGYAGPEPASGAAAVAQLEALRARGAEDLVLPAAALSWLDRFTDLRRHLERTCRLIHRDEDAWVFALGQGGPWTPVVELIADFKARHRRCPAILEWAPGLDLAATFPECAVFAPADPAADALPYMEESIDVVAVCSGDPGRLEEARRVASEAVLLLAPAAGRGDMGVTVEKRQTRVFHGQVLSSAPAGRNGAF